MLKFIFKKIYMAIVLFTQITLHATNPNPYIPQKDLPIYNIGDIAEGGVIFYLTPDGRHGLVVSVVDMKDSLNSYLINWSPDKTPIGAKGNFLMFGEDYTTAGKLNTELIVKNYSPASNNYAAKACMNYSYQMNGVTYDDWYLPSLIELGLILEMNAEINTALGSISGSAQLSTGVYWSSFEYNTDIALAWDFSGEGQSSKEKNPASPECRVRAVRAF